MKSVRQTTKTPWDECRPLTCQVQAIFEHLFFLACDCGDPGGFSALDPSSSGSGQHAPNSISATLSLVAESHVIMGIFPCLVIICDMAAAWSISTSIPRAPFCWSHHPSAHQSSIFSGVSESSLYIYVFFISCCSLCFFTLKNGRMTQPSIDISPKFENRNLG